jgi:ketosteroid isomerase-like protein
MSQQNVDLVRRSFESLNSVIRTGELRPFLDEFLDPDIDWRAVEGAIDDVSGMRGIAAVRRYIEDWLDTFDDMTMTPEEIVEVDDHRVLVHQRLSGRARQSGIETQLAIAVLYAIRDGRFVKVREYSTMAAALEAAGLSQPDAYANS